MYCATKPSRIRLVPARIKNFVRNPKIYQIESVASVSRRTLGGDVKQESGLSVEKRGGQD
jgi:hypothetical protein